jgi:hypothetical protein
MFVERDLICPFIHSLKRSGFTDICDKTAYHRALPLSPSGGQIIRKKLPAVEPENHF